MMKVVVYGVGGYDPSKLNNNVVDEYDDGQPNPDPTAVDTQALADALAALPPATLATLKAVLGL